MIKKIVYFENGNKSLVAIIVLTHSVVINRSLFFISLIVSDWSVNDSIYAKSMLVRLIIALKVEVLILQQKRKVEVVMVFMSVLVSNYAMPAGEANHVC